MILYHFTSPGHVGHILGSGGLRKGSVWVGSHPSIPFEAAYLTTSPDPDRSGVSDGTPIVLPEYMRRGGGEAIIETIDKRRVRMTLRISSGDRRLRNYVTFAKGRVDPAQLASEARQTPGGIETMRAWYFFRGTIPLDRVVRWELMDEHDDFHEVDIETVRALEPHLIGARTEGFDAGGTSRSWAYRSGPSQPEC